MRATNRVMVRPNETVVYRLADCDVTDENAPCYVVVSASMLPISSNLITVPQTQTTTSINRGFIAVCYRSITNNFGVEVVKLVQNVAVTFHTADNRAPVTLNWGDIGGSYTSSLYSWYSISGPTASPGWGSYAASQASVNTFAVVNYSIFGIQLRQDTLAVRLTIHSSGWGCS
jgi:hypothetical protein